MDHSVDDSYTPARIAIRAGSSYADLEDASILNLRGQQKSHCTMQVKIVEMDQPKGWQSYKLGTAFEGEGDENYDPSDPDA